MSDDLYTDDDAGTDQQGPEGIKSLRDAAERGKRLEPENANLRRENAFLKAGINPEESKQLSYFYKGYEGDLTADAIKAAAIEAGYIAPPPVDPAVQQHQQGQAAVMAASSGSEAQYDPAGAVYAMEKAFAEGGVDAMMQAGQQYGLKIARPQ